MRHSAVPVTVENVIWGLPYDAHFMGIILTAVNALSTCHPEQNPALAGQNVYENKEIQDKQIVRLIGEHATLKRKKSWGVGLGGGASCIIVEQYQYGSQYMPLFEESTAHTKKPHFILISLVACVQLLKSQTLRQIQGVVFGFCLEQKHSMFLLISRTCVRCKCICLILLLAVNSLSNCCPMPSTNLQARFRRSRPWRTIGRPDGGLHRRTSS